MMRFVGTLILLIATSFAAAQGGGLDDVRRMIADGQLDQALQRVDALLAQGPGERNARFLKGVVLAEMGDAAGAIDVFTRLTQDHPDLPEPYNNLAVLYGSRGDYERARDALLQAINTHPSYATAHENLGDIYAKMAALAYSRALSIDTSSSTAKKKVALMNELFLSTGALPSPAVPQPVPEPAAVAVTASLPKAGKMSLDSTRQQVIAAVREWAASWSSQNVDQYLGHYAREFRPKGGISRASWEAQRKQRLASPEFIQVEIDKPVVTSVAPDRADVVFVQRYRSNTYRDSVRKQLSLRLTESGWKITRERSLGGV